MSEIFVTEKRSRRVYLPSPAPGEIFDIRSLKDSYLSEKMMGDGIFVRPTQEEIQAPLRAFVSEVFAQNGEVHLRSEEGIELLLGLVDEQGQPLPQEYFQVKVKENQRLEAGQEIFVLTKRSSPCFCTLLITNQTYLTDIQKDLQNPQKVLSFLLDEKVDLASRNSQEADGHSQEEETDPTDKL